MIPENLLAAWQPQSQDCHNIQGITSAIVSDPSTSEISDSIKHETGHAVNNAFHDFSDSAAFQAAYDLDRDNVLKRFGPDSNPLKYYVDPVVNPDGMTNEQLESRKTEIGRDETFAEMYAAIRTLPESRTTKEQAMIDNFPNVLKVENGFLQEYNHQYTLDHKTPSTTSDKETA